MNVALVIIDVQEDFLPPDGSLAVADGRSVIPRISALIDDKYPWLAIVVTQDWHPYNHCLFASQNRVDPYTEKEFQHPLGEKNSSTGEIKTQKQIVWPDHCVQNSFGATVETLLLKKFEDVKNIPTTIVKKGYLQDREYYLCFTDCWKLHKTEMEDFLVAHSITDVVFVGLAYDFCVLNSAVDCLQSGFTTYVLSDCCKSVYPDKLKETERLYEEAGVALVENSLKLLSALQKAV